MLHELEHGQGRVPDILRLGVTQDGRYPRVDPYSDDDGYTTVDRIINP